MGGSTSSRKSDAGAAAHFAALTKPLPEPHLLVSVEGRLLAANPAAWRVFAMPPDAVGGMLGAFVDEPPERVAAFLRTTSSSSSLTPGALRMQAHDGASRRFACAGGLVQPGAPGAPGILLIRFRPHEQSIPGFLRLNERIDELTRALHDRRLANEELRAHSETLRQLAAELERQKDEAQSASLAKSRFLAAMSHELRTPLNGILGHVDLLDLGLRGPVTDAQKSQLQRIRRSTDHLIGIISEILDYSRDDADEAALHLEDADLAQTARAAAEMIEPAFEGSGVSLQYDLPPCPLPVTTDHGRVRQILLNLLANAARFTTSGSVRMEVRPCEDGAAVAVRDTGCGIAQEDLERIFEPFWQGGRREGGTGLGLTITRGLARKLGAEIEVESVVGAGSTFTLILPEQAQ